VTITHLLVSAVDGIIIPITLQTNAVSLTVNFSGFLLLREPKYPLV